MPVFTDAEIAYLEAQPLIRIGSVSPSGQTDVSVATFGVDGDTLVSGGFAIEKTVRFKNVLSNPRVSVIIDDLPITDPWSPRGFKVRGTMVAEEHDGGMQFRITPEVIWSWGINTKTEGIPPMERRTVPEA
ncbi:unannotated protein [freshwater metagenome]|uniref:Unannotated protein n=2 Tax=freshwater metagenome TaxID=449393 RepID=A0A6J7D9K5_9ZZZZ|nr:PPOX class F420-dependent oxidoreductase [Actinomycetota bacterium]MSZ29936.1 PPOX class F420-dependent oxidoreductase [Actinomycetota bacterium]